jgi:hypothetical protein
VRSTASKGSAHPRLYLPPQPNPHSGVRGALRASPPRVRSLAAFGRRPPVDVARLTLAGIRNPAQQETPALQQTARFIRSASSARTRGPGDLVPCHDVLHRRSVGRTKDLGLETALAFPTVPNMTDLSPVPILRPFGSDQLIGTLDTGRTENEATFGRRQFNLPNFALA